jgi:uncharacterized membrane protein (TIGR02234 family)
VVLAAGRTWVTAAPSDVPGVTRVQAAGSQAAPAVSALALTAAAAAVALLVTGRVGRRLAAVVMLLAGLGVAGTAALVVAGPAGAAQGTVAAATGRTGGAVPATTLSGWVWLALAAGLLVAGCGAYALLRAASWPAPGRRFESASGGSGPAPGQGGGDTATAPAVPDAIGAWDALSRGDDPTG